MRKSKKTKKARTKMGKSNTELYKIASSYLGDGGSRFRSYCGLPSGAAWCCAFVTYIFHAGNDDNLFYGGKKVVYVPTAEKWCSAHLAQIPIYLAMPMDIITFDWNNNGVPDHIGFVRERKSDTEVYTIEGNTSGGIVAKKTRPLKYISGVFRPEFKGKFDTSKALVIDGQFSILHQMQRQHIILLHILHLFLLVRLWWWHHASQSLITVHRGCEKEEYQQHE